MTIKNLFIRFFLLFCASTSMSGQGWNSELFDTRSGMVSSNIRELFQDSSKYLWIMTNKPVLMRFDGSNFKKFYLNSGEGSQMPYSLFCQKGGNVWAPSGKGGLWYFEGGKQFEQIKLPPKYESLSIFGVFIDKNNQFWTVTGTNKETDEPGFDLRCYSAVVTQQIQTEKFFDPEAPIFEHQFKSKSCFPLNFKSPKTGIVWVSISNTLHKFTDFKHKKIWESNEHKQHFSPVIKQFICVNSDTVLLRNRMSEIYKIAKNSVSKLFIGEFADGNFFKMKNGNWLISDSNGFSITDSNFSELSYENLNKTENIDHINTSLLDHEGNLWVGSTQGLICISRHKFTQYPMWNDSLWKNAVFSIAKNRNDEILIAANIDRGIFSLQKNKSKKPKRITHPTEFSPSAEIQGMFWDKNEDFWLWSNWNGIEKWSNEGRFSRFLFDTLSTDVDLQCVTEGFDGTIWLGTTGGIIWGEENRPGKMPTFRYLVDPKTINQPLNVNCIKTAPDNWTWVGHQKGLVAFPPGSEEPNFLELKKLFPELPEVISVKKILFTPEGHLWIATETEGILQVKWNREHQIEAIRHFDRRDGLIFNYPKSMIYDSRGRIWIIFPGVIASILPDVNDIQILNFRKEDGLPNLVFDSGQIIEHRDTLWAATSSGLVSLNLQALRLNKPKLSIEQISFKGNPISPENLQFEKCHPNDSIQIQIAGICLANGDKSFAEFAIQNEQDKAPLKWNKLNDKRLVTFSGLQPGNYQLQLRLTNHYGMRSKAAIYPIRVRKLFWETVWFRTLFGVLVFLLAISLLRNRSLKQQQVKDQRRIEEERMKKNRAVLQAEKLIVHSKLMQVHFVSRALNSAQEAILNNSLEEANTILRQFEKFYHRVVKLADLGSIIPIKEEVDFLNEYMNLMKLSHNLKDFSFQIKQTGELQNAYLQESIPVPTLLLQPLVENAILHGLIPSQKRKTVDITFTHLEEDELLIISIADNGVGFSAEKIAKRRVRSSFSMKKIKERLELIKTQTGKTAKLEIIHKTEKKTNEAIATIIQIIIPDNLTQSQLRRL